MSWFNDNSENFESKPINAFWDDLTYKWDDLLASWDAKPSAWFTSNSENWETPNV